MSTPGQPKVNPSTLLIRANPNQPQVNPSQPQANPKSTEVNPKSAEVNPSQPQVNSKSTPINHKSTPSQSQVKRSQPHVNKFRNFAEPWQPKSTLRQPKSTTPFKANTYVRRRVRYTHGIPKGRKQKSNMLWSMANCYRPVRSVGNVWHELRLTHPDPYVYICMDRRG
jgi:hypothetical protein